MVAKKIAVCRLVYEFTPKTGGSITHIIETSTNIHPHLFKQIIVAPEFDDVSLKTDQDFKVDIKRVHFVQFKMLQYINNYLVKPLPIAPIVCFSYGISSIRMIHSLSKKTKIDIVHAHGIQMGAVASVAGKLFNKNVIWMLHGTQDAYSTSSSKFETFILKLFRPAYVIALDDGSPAVSKFRKVLGDEHIITVRHAIDHSFFYPKQPDRELLNRLCISEDTFVILAPHKLIPVKGIEHTISAYRLFIDLNKHKKSVLIIAGNGPLKKELEEKAWNFGITDNTLFVGEVDISMMPDYYSISDMVISSSTYSNMNRSTQEAMACGKPVVAFNSGGTKDVIDHMKTGILVEPGNIEQLAYAMLQLSNDAEMRKNMGVSARDYIVKNRSWESRILTELSVYEQVMSGNRQRVHPAH